MPNLNEIGYDQIFSPETIASLKGKSGDSLRQMLGNQNLRQVLTRTMQLLPEISAAEAEYIDELEMLAVQMVQDAYPILSYADIQIDAKIGEMEEVLDLLKQDKKPPKLKKSMELVQHIPDDKKRRIINGITQGASIRGAFWYLMFREYIDQLDPTLVEKYREIMNLTLGVYDDEQFLALLLASLAQNGAEGGGAGGASMVEVLTPENDDEDEEGEENEEEPVLKITVRALNFPMLVYEIVKGLYEILSLQGFSADKEKNKSVVANIDKLENEPDDLRLGKFIYDAISNLYVNSNFTDDRIRELLFVELYKTNDENFFPFIENAINDKLTPQQMRWAHETMRDIEQDLKADDSDQAMMMERFKKLGGIS